MKTPKNIETPARYHDNEEPLEEEFILPESAVIKWQDKSNVKKESNQNEGDNIKEIIEFPNGDVYMGYLKNGKPCGEGTMTYKDGAEYKGIWKNGKPNGQGIHLAPIADYSDKWDKIEKYREQYHATYGKSESVDTYRRRLALVHGKRDIFKGTFRNGVLHGYGMVTYKNGDIYNGNWDNGSRTGKGEMQYSDGRSYSGDWKEGLYHGKGKYTGPEGIYDGEWKEHNRHGNGAMESTDGRSYAGYWREEMYHGQGKYTGPEGIYDGEWKNGSRAGIGKMQYSDGRSYTGYWKDGKEHGQGVLVCADGSKYRGEWKDGLMHRKILDLRGKSRIYEERATVSNKSHETVLQSSETSTNPDVNNRTKQDKRAAAAKKDQKQGSSSKDDQTVGGFRPSFVNLLHRVINNSITGGAVGPAEKVDGVPMKQLVQSSETPTNPDVNNRTKQDKRAAAKKDQKQGSSSKDSQTRRYFRESLAKRLGNSMRHYI